MQNLKSIRYWYKFYNSDENGLQAVSQMELIKKLVRSIPWGHNQRIMYKCKNIAEALFYAQKTLDNGWSRTVLEHQIDSGLSDLAEPTLKNPYNFDFLTLREKYDEKELEDALINQITQFLLELVSKENKTEALLVKEKFTGNFERNYGFEKEEETVVTDLLPYVEK